MTIPALPKYILSTSTSDYTALSSAGGAVGILFDGATVYSAYGGQGFGTVTAYSNSAPYAEGYTFDQCGQHSSGNSPGAYHSHVPPACLLNQLGASATSPSPLIGYMVDGFPIYGPRGPGGVYMKQCGQTGADATYCTDYCGGYYDSSQSVWADGYVYRYFIMGPHNGITDICANDMWRDGVFSGSGTVITSSPYSSCSYSFAKTFYPFTPICLRGCLPSSITGSTGFTGSNANLSPTCPSTTSKYTAGYTDSTKIKTTSALPVNPYLSALTTCMNSDCSGSYPNPNTCVHDSNTGAYIGPTLAPTITPSSASRMPASPTNAPSVSPTVPTSLPSLRPSSPTASPTSVPTSAPASNPSPSSSSSGSQCFAANESIEMASGELKAIASVRVGDEVVGMDNTGMLKTSPVVAVPHAANDKLTSFTEIRTVAGRTITLTPNHLLLVHKSATRGGAQRRCEQLQGLSAFRLLAAREVSAGDCLLAQTGSGEEVEGSRAVWSRGIYTIVSNEAFVVVSGFVASPFSTNHEVPDKFYSIHRFLFALSSGQFASWTRWSQLVSLSLGSIVNALFDALAVAQASSIYTQGCGYFVLP